MIYCHILFLIVSILLSFLVNGLNAASTRRSSANCQPFHSTFSAAEISPPSLFYQPPFVPVSPPQSYAVDNDGLQLFMDKPKGNVKTKNGVNSVVAEGATVNSTFAFSHAVVSMEVVAPEVAGSVTAAILIAAARDSHDEIDVELLGGDPSHWQTNVFTMSPQDKEPLYGIFGGIERYPKKSTISKAHNYTIDWNTDRIIWSVDGDEVRTLKKDETRVNGTYHYPTHPLRIQLGIWDASNPIGTSEWARGPINWDTAPARMTAVFKSVTVECPY